MYPLSEDCSVAEATSGRKTKPRETAPVVNEEVIMMLLSSFGFLEGMSFSLLSYVIIRCYRSLSVTNPLFQAYERWVEEHESDFKKFDAMELVVE